MFPHKAEIQRLTSGAKIIAVEVDDAAYSAVGAYLPAGSRTDPVGKDGIAHLLEHCLAVRPRARIGDLSHLEALDALGIDATAATGKEIVSFRHTQLEDAIASSCELLLNTLCWPSISEADVDHELGVVGHERDEGSQAPRDAILQQAFAALWPGDPISRPTLGSSASLSQIRCEDLSRFYNERYQTAQLTYVIAGTSQNIATIRSIVEDFTLNSRGSSSLARTDPFVDIDQHARVIESDRGLAEVGIFVRTDGVFDQKDRIILSFLKNYLADSWLSVLVRDLRLREHLTYWVEAESGFFSDRGYIGIYFTTAQANLDRAVAVIATEFDHLRIGTIADELLTQHKRSHIAGVLKGSADPLTLLEWYGDESVLGAPLLDYPTYIKGVNNITPASIAQVACRYFTRENMCLIMSGNSDHTAVEELFERLAG